VARSRAIGLRSLVQGSELCLWVFKTMRRKRALAFLPRTRGEGDAGP
jgi:hypothetical protein